MYVMGIDPGGTTGVVMLRLDKDHTYTVEGVWQLPWGERFHLMHILWGDEPVPDLIVVESFRLYATHAEAQIRSAFPSSQVIGIVDASLWGAGLLDRRMQQGASMIRDVAIPDEHLPLLDPLTEHTKDAYKHARFALLKHYDMNARPV